MRLSKNIITVLILFLIIAPLYTNCGDSKQNELDDDLAVQNL
jgi:hypothetical protein